MASIEYDFLRSQLVERRQKLETAVTSTSNQAPLAHLLKEIDAALARMDDGSYGICDECHESIEKNRLLADPLIQVCIDHLNAEERRALEADLELAGRIQRALLPPQDVRAAGWEVHYHYQPAGPVSGDYCDLIHPNGGHEDLFFALGDVSGKGVAASLLMSHLHAMFRSLVSVKLPLEDLMALANRVFCESTIAGQYATLVCGRAAASGKVEIASAGHPPAFLICNGGVKPLAATGLPLGMFGKGEYSVQRAALQPGENLILYTDGLNETRDGSNREYGFERLAKFLGARHSLPARALTAACLDELNAFSNGARQLDDRTIMVLRREN
jgi:sigma-B regulation protein RsbU (phosphoserine phosphatase)